MNHFFHQKSQIVTLHQRNVLTKMLYTLHFDGEDSLLWYSMLECMMWVKGEHAQWAVNGALIAWWRSHHSWSVLIVLQFFNLAKSFWGLVIQFASSKFPFNKFSTLHAPIMIDQNGSRENDQGISVIGTASSHERSPQNNTRIASPWVFHHNFNALALTRKERAPSRANSVECVKWSVLYERRNYFPARVYFIF